MIYDEIMDELKDRNVYLHKIYAPYYIMSYAMHGFNIYNQHNHVYWESKRIPNMRLHLLFIAPPGGMKSFYMGTMGGDNHSIMGDTGFIMNYEASMTEAGFVGTLKDLGDGIVHTTEGAAQTYEKGFCIIDEFSAITNGMKVSYNSQMDTQLLNVLDSGDVNKRLGSGKLEYHTDMTLWAGVQPARIDARSGLGRRLTFLNFLPTSVDNDNLMEAMHHNRNIKCDVSVRNVLREKIKQFNTDMECIKRIVFPDDIIEYYRNLGLASFEAPLFDRLILGYNLTKYGCSSRIDIEYGDKELRLILEREKEWRDEAMDIDYNQILQIIKINGGSITKRELVRECVRIGWNTQQVYDKVGDMLKYEMVKMNKNKIVVV